MVFKLNMCCLQDFDVDNVDLTLREESTAGTEECLELKKKAE